MFIPQLFCPNLLVNPSASLMSKVNCLRLILSKFNAYSKFHHLMAKLGLKDVPSSNELILVKWVTPFSQEQLGHSHNVCEDLLVVKPSYFVIVTRSPVIVFAIDGPGCPWTC